MQHVIVIDHPVVQTKLTELRDFSADHRKFRTLLDEIAALMVYEVTRDWPTTPKPVQTPLERTTGRGIAMTEMSMGAIEGNVVRDALGVGVYCGDWSHCEIEDNAVVGTRPDPASGARSRMGYAIQSGYYARAELKDNALARNPRPMGAFTNSTITDR